MENKTGKIIIVSGENMTFNSDEVFFNSFSDIENNAIGKIVKHGELNGRVFGDYTDLVAEDNDIIVKEELSFNFYHTWNPTQKDTKHIGNDSIIINEIRIIKVFKNGIELINSKERFVTDYFTHINDWAEVDGFAYSTFYYHDSTNLRQPLKKENYTPMTEVVSKYVNGVAKYKKEHRYGSPIQEQAVQNKEENKSTSMILTSSTIIGSIIAQIPNPYAKYGGKIIAGISKGLNAIITKPEHAEEVAIMFKLKYEK